MANYVKQLIRQQKNDMAVPSSYVFSDLNARDELVSDSTDVLLYDVDVVLQEAWRLITTEEGEIPNFRNYGLNMKQFSQYPLTSEIVNGIYDYVKSRIEAFVESAEVIRANVDVDFDEGFISYVFFLRLRASGYVAALPTWVVQVSTM